MFILTFFIYYYTETFFIPDLLFLTKRNIIKLSRKE